MAKRFWTSYNETAPVASCTPDTSWGILTTNAAYLLENAEATFSTGAWGSSTVAVPRNGGQNTYMNYQFITPPLPAQTLSGTVRGVWKHYVSDAALDNLQYPKIVIRVVNNDGSNKSPVRYALQAIGTVPLTSTFQTIRMRDAAGNLDLPLNAVSIGANDRLVIEIGASGPGGSKAANTTVRIENNEAADYAWQDYIGSGTNGNSWIEFSNDITVAGSTTPKSMAATETPGKTISMVKTKRVVLNASTTPAKTLSVKKTLSKSLAATEITVKSLVRKLDLKRVLSVTKAPIPTISQKKTIKQSLSSTASSVKSLSNKLTVGRLLQSSSSNSPSINSKATKGRTLPASAGNTTSIKKYVKKNLNATTQVMVTLMHVSLMYLLLNAISSHSNSLIHRMSRYMTLNGSSTNSVSLDTMSFSSRTLNVVVSIPLSILKNVKKTLASSGSVVASLNRGQQRYMDLNASSIVLNQLQKVSSCFKNLSSSSTNSVSLDTMTIGGRTLSVSAITNISLGRLIKKTFNVTATINKTLNGVSSHYRTLSISNSFNAIIDDIKHLNLVVQANALPGLIKGALHYRLLDTFTSVEFKAVDELKTIKKAFNLNSSANVVLLKIGSWYKVISVVSLNQPNLVRQATWSRTLSEIVSHSAIISNVQSFYRTLQSSSAIIISLATDFTAYKLLPAISQNNVNLNKKFYKLLSSTFTSVLSIVGDKDANTLYKSLSTASGSILSLGYSIGKNLNVQTSVLSAFSKTSTFYRTLSASMSSVPTLFNGTSLYIVMNALSNSITSINIKNTFIRTLNALGSPIAIIRRGISKVLFNSQNINTNLSHSSMRYRTLLGNITNNTSMNEGIKKLKALNVSSIVNTSIIKSKSLYRTLTKITGTTVTFSRIVTRYRLLSVSRSFVVSLSIGTQRTLSQSLNVVVSGLGSVNKRFTYLRNLNSQSIILSSLSTMKTIKVSMLAITNSIAYIGIKVGKLIEYALVSIPQLASKRTTFKVLNGISGNFSDIIGATGSNKIIRAFINPEVSIDETRLQRLFVQVNTSTEILKDYALSIYHLLMKVPMSKTISFNVPIQETIEVKVLMTKTETFKVGLIKTKEFTVGLTKTIRAKLRSVRQ